MVKKDWKSNWFWHFWLISNIFDCLIDISAKFFNRLIDIIVDLIDFDIHLIKNRPNLYQNCDTISSLKSETDWNRWSNTDGLESKLLTIWFWRPNHNSLVYNGIWLDRALPCLQGHTPSLRLRSGRLPLPPLCYGLG